MHPSMAVSMQWCARARQVRELQGDQVTVWVVKPHHCDRESAHLLPIIRTPRAAIPQYLSIRFERRREGGLGEIEERN